VASVSAALGPSVAALILSFAPWPWLFAINIPIGLLAFSIAIWALPRTPTSSHPFDGVAAVLNALTFGLLVLAVDGLAHHDRLVVILTEFAVSLIAGVLLFLREAAATAPMFPVDLLRIPIFALSVATSIAAFSAQSLAFVSLPFLFEIRLHFDDVATGLLMTPWPVAVALVAPFAGRLADRYPAGLLGGVGLVTMAAGLAALALLPAHPALPSIVWRMMVCGFGFGFFNSPNNRAMLTAAPRERSGGASGMLATARLLGQTGGAALVALCFAVAGSGGARLALALGAGAAAAAAGASVLRLTPLAAPQK